MLNIDSINRHEVMKDKLVEYISRYPGVMQKKIFVEFVDRRRHMATDTVRKYLNELVDTKKINCREQGKYLKYTAKNIMHEDDLDKTLCSYLDDIMKKSDILKNEITKYSYNVKNALLDPLSSIPDHMDRSIDYAQEEFGKDIDYLQTKNFIHDISKKLFESSNDISTERAILKYIKNTRELNDKLLEQKNQLPKIRGKQKRSIIYKKIEEIRIKLEPLYHDLYTINEKLDNDELLDSFVDKMNKKYQHTTKNKA